MQINALSRLKGDVWTCLLPSTSPTESRSGNTAKRLRVVAKTLRVMQLTAFFLLALAISVSAKTSSQTVTLNVKDTKLEKLFIEVKNQTGFVFVYNKEAIEKSSPVSIEARNVPLKEFMDEVLKHGPFDYAIRNKTVFIRLRKPTRGIIFPSITSALNPPPITGRVTDVSGNALAGINVMVKGTGTGTTTDDNGEFSISNIDQNATLVISGIGYESREIVLSSSSPISVSLKISENKLDEVVFKGYYQESRRYSTGSVSKVSSAAIEKQPVSNPLQALQGRMAGVYIQQNTGVPGGSGFSVQIRGRSSLRSTANDPLYVIDGVPFTSTSLHSGAGSTIVPSGSPLNSLNPSDIHSIEILKDADATAIYGSRGANGVVLITTKRGIVGKTTVEINVIKGIGQVAKTMDLLNTQQYIQMRKEAYVNDEIEPTGSAASDLLQWDSTRYTDWQKEFLRNNADRTNINLSATGGNAQNQFLVKGGYFKETTVYPGDFSYKRGSLHFNSRHVSLNQKLSIANTIEYVTENNNLPTSDFVTLAVRLPPNAPTLYSPDGSLNWANATWTNPLSQLLKKYTAKTERLLISTSLSYQLLQNLWIKSNLGLTNLTMEELATNPVSSFRPGSGNTGFTQFGNGSLKSWVIEPQVEYQNKGRLGDLTILTGGTFQQNTRTKQTIIGVGYTSDAFIENVLAAPMVIPDANTSSQYKYQGVFGRVNYNLFQKYIINVTGRRDGSSRFGSRNQFANFGAIGTAWIFTKEPFISTALPFLHFGKIRLSYGSTGSDQIGDYGYLENYSLLTPYQGTSLSPVNIANPDYAWEVNKKFDAAIELAFLNDDIRLVLDWFRNRTSNQLIGEPLPAVTGFTTIQANFPAIVQNTGLEIEVASTNISKSHFKWSSSFNLTIPRNKLISFPLIEKSAYRNLYTVGESLSATKKLHYLGVNPATGIYEFEDVDGNGSVTDEVDLKVSKAIGPKFYGGLANQINYRKWELSFLIQFVKQIGLSYKTSFSPPGSKVNQPAIVMNRWSKAGENTDVQRFSQSFSPYGIAYNNLRNSDNMLIDASFIRLQNINLAWQIPFRDQKGMKIPRAKLFLQAQNVITITSYLGFDPENYSASRLPPLRFFAGGIQITL